MTLSRRTDTTHALHPVEIDSGAFLSGAATIGHATWAGSVLLRPLSVVQIVVHTARHRPSQRGTGQHARVLGRQRTTTSQHSATRVITRASSFTRKRSSVRVRYRPPSIRGSSRPGPPHLPPSRAAARGCGRDARTTLAAEVRPRGGCRSGGAGTPDRCRPSWAGRWHPTAPNRVRHDRARHRALVSFSAYTWVVSARPMTSSGRSFPCEGSSS